MITDRPYDVVNSVPMTRFDGIAGAKLYLVHRPNEWEAFHDLLMKQKFVACDTETTGFEYYKNDRICGMSFGWADTHFYVPVRHKPSALNPNVVPQLDMDNIRPQLQEFFGQKDVMTVWHNAKFDIHFYESDEIDILTPFHDTRILWHFFNENAPGALKTIASGWKDIMGRKQPGIVHPDAAAKEKELDVWRTKEAQLRRREYSAAVMEKADELQKDPAYQHMGRRDLKNWIKEHLLVDHPYREAKKTDVDYSYVPVELMCEYAGMDTFITNKVYEYVMENMKFSKKLQKLYINEIKLSKVLKDTERDGVLIDRTYLEDLSAGWQKEIEERAAHVKETFIAAGCSEDINIGSNQQLAEGLQLLGAPLTKRTATGNLAVDKQVLEKLAKDYEVVQEILDLRTIEKLKNTYADSIVAKLTDDDILHCHFNANVKTGRMSSRDPNLQNIPGRDTSIRQAFLNLDDDHVFLFLDYSQIEVRLTAHYSQDPLLMEAYALGQDVHTRTSCEMFGFDYDEVVNADPDDPRQKMWKLYRTVSKRINFGIVYGVGAPGLSDQIPRPEDMKHLSQPEWVDACQEFINNYFDKYRGVRKFIKQAERFVARNCYAENYFGRVRHLPHARATKLMKDKSQFWREGRAKRQGMNFMIQGTAADVFKIAVVRVADLLKDKKSRIVNFVHDEIQIYLHKSEMYLLPKIKELMEDFDFSVPLLADIEWSTTNWAAKKELKV